MSPHLIALLALASVALVGLILGYCLCTLRIPRILASMTPDESHALGQRVRARRTATKE